MVQEFIRNFREKWVVNSHGSSTYFDTPVHGPVELITNLERYWPKVRLKIKLRVLLNFEK